MRLFSNFYFPIEIQTTTNEEFFIEEKKYNALKKDYEEKNIIPLYINFFQDGYHVWLVNLEQYFNGKKNYIIFMSILSSVIFTYINV